MNQFITAGLGWFVTVICLIRIRYQHFLAMSRLYTKKKPTTTTTTDSGAKGTCKNAVLSGNLSSCFLLNLAN